MKGALKIATFAKIPIFIHWTILLFLGMIVYVAYEFQLEPKEYFFMFLFSISMYILVILHEYGHALTARKYGVNTRDIIISPIGGVARLERIPEKPIQEFFVAIAGPAVNLFIGLLILPILYFGREHGFHLLGEEIDFFSKYENFLPMVFYANGILAVFNMVPAFPMDGGRVLRALLSMKIHRVKATQIASIIGQIIAVGFFIYGFSVGKLILPFIGIFVFLMARSEYRNVKIEHLLNSTSAAKIVESTFSSLMESDTIASANEQRVNGATNFLVYKNQDQISGILPMVFLIDAVKQKDLESPISNYMSPLFEKVDGGSSLSVLIHKFRQNNYTLVPVYENDQLIGIISIDTINNFINNQGKLKA